MTSSSACACPSRPLSSQIDTSSFGFNAEWLGEQLWVDYQEADFWRLKNLCCGEGKSTLVSFDSTRHFEGQRNYAGFCFECLKGMCMTRIAVDSPNTNDDSRTSGTRSPLAA